MYYHAAFNKRWFERHQRKLLFLLKFRLFRWLWRVDVPGKVFKIEPNAVWYFDGEAHTEFRVHNKYAKRLYYSLRPLWWTMHVLDFFLDKHIPQWSFGFYELTAYPDADPESTTMDGYADQYEAGGVTWATLIAAAGNNSGDSDSTIDVVRIWAHSDSGKFQLNRRGFFLFDTSSIGTGKVISAATLSLKGSAKTDPLSTSPDINIYSSNPASNTAIANGDYDSVGSTAFSDTISYSSFSDSAYNDFALNEDGIDNIAVEGVSKFSTREVTHDIGSTTPDWVSGAQSYLRAVAADTTGTASDPKLVVTYADDGFYPFPSHLIP